MSSFTSNSYFVSINSVSIIRSCRVVTIQMKLVLTNWGNRSFIWSGIRCIYTDSLMKLRCHKCYIYINHSIRSKTCINSVPKHSCVAHTQQFCCGFDQNYFHQQNLAKTVNFLSKSLHFNFLFIKMLLYKISVTLQWCFFYRIDICIYTFLWVTLCVLSLTLAVQASSGMT